MSGKEGKFEVGVEAGKLEAVAKARFPQPQMSRVGEDLGVVSS